MEYNPKLYNKNKLIIIFVGVVRRNYSNKVFFHIYENLNSKKLLKSQIELKRMLRSTFCLEV